jgi:23S rRNA pseudouridine2605 synthase
MQHGGRYHAFLTRSWWSGGMADRADEGTEPADPSTSERLQRYLARAGVASRRKAEALIVAGRVTVDGTVAVLGTKVSPGQRVLLDGAPVAARTEHRSFALHKPAGYVTTAADERRRRTVLELVPKVPGLHPVGRLDLDSEGLLLLTTDGALTDRLTHPRFGHTKTYRVWCEGGALPRAACRRLEDGVTLDDGPARALRARPAPGGAVVELGDGRKRQVRRMFDAIDHPVQRLLRTHVGGFALGELPLGGYRELGPEDLRRLGYTPGNDDARPSRTASVPRDRPPGARPTRRRDEEP